MVADRGLVGPPAVIVDAAGNVIVRDGTTVAVQASGWPMLADRTLCPAADVILVSRGAP